MSNNTRRETMWTRMTVGMVWAGRCFLNPGSRNRIARPTRADRRANGDLRPGWLDRFNDTLDVFGHYLHPTRGYRVVSFKRAIAAHLVVTRQVWPWTSLKYVKYALANGI